MPKSNSIAVATHAYESNVSKVDSNAWIPAGRFQGCILEWFISQNSAGRGL